MGDQFVQVVVITAVFGLLLCLGVIWYLCEWGQGQQKEAEKFRKSAIDWHKSANYWMARASYAEYGDPLELSDLFLVEDSNHASDTQR